MKAPSPAAAPSLSLHIGSLALPGYSPRDGARLAGSFERELGRLLTLQALPAQGFQADCLQLPALRRQAGERPELTGRRLARLIAEQLRD
ncbi:hypothetical protein A9179_15510 [Pseudomonas alcaligenes]|uniref:Arginase n=1 Tax=Aquipseudomonas alcaligenes TaxID=43263 RepID=A0ABR7S273_AQUAC|nr:hypothetical protein [Pseudomonas alcaligenes]MBC9251680.1 hypothetical protein [Pseudomonas alcaligenes]